MFAVPSLRRLILLSLTMLSACGAADSGRTPVSTDQGPVDVQIYGPMGAYLSGRSALRTGDADTAASILLKGLALDPTNDELQNVAFFAAMRAGRPEMVDLARQSPGSLAAQLVLANDDIMAGRWSAAERRFASIVQKGPIQVLQPIMIAWAQFGDGRTDAALATLLPLADNPRGAGLYALHVALIADLAGRVPLATRMYPLAESTNGAGNVQIARILASWAARNGKQAEVQKKLAPFEDSIGNLALTVPELTRHAADIQVHNARDGLAEAYFALGGALRGQEGGEVSDLFIRLALDLRPDFTLANILQSETDEEAGYAEQSLNDLRNVAGTDPLSPLAEMRRAALYAKLGKQDKALAVLDHLQQDHPTRPEPYTLRGDILRDAKRFPEAVAAYSGAIERLGKPVSAYWGLFYERGIAFDQAKQPDKAEKDFLHALELQPDQPFVLNYLGYSWTEQGRNLPRAHKMIERAVAQRPDDAAIVDSLGWLELKQGNTKGAVRLLQRAVELQPSDATLNAHLGDAYWAAGRKLEAQFQWRRALTSSPEPDDVPKLEAKLRDSETALGNRLPKSAKP